MMTNEQLRERDGVNGGSYDEQLSISKLAIVERVRSRRAWQVRQDHLARGDSRPRPER